jgi:hypothetical protein
MNEWSHGIIKRETMRIFKILYSKKRSNLTYITESLKGIIKKSSKIIIAPEPFDLWSGVTIDNIAFFILEIPGNDNEDIPFAYPDFLFDLSLDSPHPGHTIVTSDPDMVCTHHQFSGTEHFPVSFLGQFYPYNLITRR